MSKILTVHFTSDGLPTIGLTPTIDIYEITSGVDTLVISSGSVIEIGNGWYKYVFSSYLPNKNYIFTFDGGSSMFDCERYKVGGNESYSEDTASMVWDEPTLAHLGLGTTGFALTQIQTDTHQTQIAQPTLVTLLNLLLKYERNRTKIDVVNATMTIYDDDCITPLTVFNLTDSLGNPSIQEVCARTPTTCV